LVVFRTAGRPSGDRVFSLKSTDRPKAVEVSVVHDAAGVETLSGLSGFRAGFYECLTARADALFELADAAICADGPVTSLAELSLAPVFRRGHGALYDALAGGAVDEERLRDLLAGQLPAGAPLMFGIDATTFPRPNAECSPDRGLHYAPCRCDGDRKVVPGWQFQWVMGLEWGSSSWTLWGSRTRPRVLNWSSMRLARTR
jgi:hypothetical protein